MGVLGGAGILQELILALGGALLVGNLAVVVRERRRRDGAEPGQKPNMKVVSLNVLVGFVLTFWAAASIIASR